MTVSVLVGDCRERLAEIEARSVHTCVTSPPYFGLRDYGVEGQMGLEPTPEDFVAGMVAVFREVRRVLRDDGTLWLNIADSYHNKHRLMVPARLAIGMAEDGWIIRDEIVWQKPNAKPEPVKDRTVMAHEMLFMFTKQRRYHYDHLAIQEPATCTRLPGRGMTDTKETYGRKNGGNSGLAALRRRLVDQGHTDTKRNKRSVWTVVPMPIPGVKHFATFPPALIEPCILAGAPIGGTVLDPFYGAGTTGLVADRLGRDCIGIELNPEYAAMAELRLLMS